MLSPDVAKDLVCQMNNADKNYITFKSEGDTYIVSLAQAQCAIGNSNNANDKEYKLWFQWATTGKCTCMDCAEKVPEAARKRFEMGKEL